MNSYGLTFVESKEKKYRSKMSANSFVDEGNMYVF